jgi:misacylated tRNA(Ala) deacylase
MTELVFLEDPYCKSLAARVTAVHEDGSLSFDRTICFATGGGQPGDTGTIRSEGGALQLAGTVKGESLTDIRHLLAEGCALPRTGEEIEIELDWERRYRHMRMHTLMHLVLAAIPVHINGCQIGAEKSRIDMNLPDGPPDKDWLQETLNAMVAADHRTSQSQMSETELASKPELVRTMAVAPPSNGGMVRLVIIGDPSAPLDIQPCGGTHVASTAEVGRVELGKIENKGKHNRRINLLLPD